MGMFWTVLVVLIVLTVGLSALYTRLVGQRMRCQEAYRRLAEALRKRYNLLPNLLQAVRSVAPHETEALDHVEAARQRAILAEQPDVKVEAEDELTYRIDRLLTAASRHPMLKASTDYARLRGELREVQERIAAAEEYNDAVEAYNRLHDRKPYCWVARLVGLTRRRPMHLDKPAEGQAT